MHTYHFRIAANTDVPHISELVNAAYRPTGQSAGWTNESALVAGDRTSPALVAALLQRPSSVILLATNENGQIDGCVHIEAEQQQAHIGMLAVAPQRQTGGLGKRLLSEAEHVACRQFGVTVLLLTVIQQREELRAYYLRRGYQPNGTCYPYPQDAGAGVPFSGELRVEVLTKAVAATASAASIYI